MTDKATETASSPLFPIREVSRLTGVNSVTLRAWERRYGLIEPRRTPKGHRLYAREDIERIEHILQWLNRGVPVSQVRELLDQPQPESTPMPDEGSWSGQQQLALSAIDAQDEVRLAELYNQSLALYPVNSVVERLWRPLLEQLEERGTATFGARLAQCFFESFLRSRIGARLVFANQERHAPHITLTRLPEEPGLSWLLLFALVASDAGYHVSLLDGPLPLGELPLAAERLQAQAVVLVGTQAESSDVMRRQLPRIAEQLSVPLAIAGPAAQIRQQELVDGPIEALGADPIQAVARLRPLMAR